MGVLRRVRDFFGTYFCTIATVAFCAMLLVYVPQVRYAFNCSGWTVLPVICFGIYFGVSSVGILSGGLVFSRKTFRASNDASSGPKLKPIYAVFLWVVTWPNWTARKLTAKSRGYVSIALFLAAIASTAVWTQGLGRHAWAPLSGLLWINLTWMFAAPAVWLCFCKPEEWAEPGNAPTSRQVMGWRIGWLCSTALLGELIWFLASFQLAPAFGFLMYTQWAVMQFLSFVVLTAHTLDYLDRELKLPVRLAGVVVVVVAQLFYLSPERVATRIPEVNDEVDAAEGIDDSAWIAHLERRVDAVPVGPCVIVAASGGGTRAALFASLVLGAAERETSFADYKFKEHVVLTSSVSGGSLAVAETLIGPGILNGGQKRSASNDRKEITRFIEEALRDELANLTSDAVEARAQTEVLKEQLAARIAVVKQRLASMESFVSGDSDDSWLLADPVVDNISTDFMAPILRGAITPLVSRGESLRRFWEQSFRWENISNINSGRLQSDSSVSPLLLFNACNTAWGTRFAIGFPALPQPFFKADAAATSVPTRYPVRALSDLDPLHEIHLADAVRLSSNFPWGFRVRTLAETNLLDGGMVDNTGIDTVYEVFRRLEQSERGKRVLAKIARKGVFLLEIDSGGKPRGKRDQASQSGGLLEPLATMGNALHTNADIVKEYYIASLDEMFRQALEADLEAQISQLAASGQVTKSDFQSLRVFVHVPFQCEDFGGSPLTAKEHRTVMTAWALDSKQKAQVMARFLVELSMFRNTIEEHRGALLKDLEQLAALDGLVLADTLRRATEELATLALNQKALPEINRDFIQKLVDLESTRVSATNSEQTQLLAHVAPITKKGWIQSANPMQANQSQMLLVDSPTRDQLDQLERETNEAATRLDGEQKRLQGEFVELIKERHEESSFGKIRQQFQAKQSLVDQILD